MMTSMQSRTDGKSWVARLAAAAVLASSLVAAPGPDDQRDPPQGDGDTSLAQTLSQVADLFDARAAMELCRDLDQYYRVRGNEGYMHSVERIISVLEEAGYSWERIAELRDLGAI